MFSLFQVVFPLAPPANITRHIDNYNQDIKILPEGADLDSMEAEMPPDEREREFRIWSSVFRASGLLTGDGRDLVAVTPPPPPGCCPCWPAAWAAAAWAAATSLFPLCMSSRCRVECLVGPT